ncbi:redoxin domain-containing protein [Tautonia sociabilis]|uniref:Redoxin domain-containing protein n=1 Tax=Tautonia sociabilis TaxID=2080755 RepID=A0A432MP72_9BACT|nr:redoxin domain-containing protein [Tautonia sociabilis]
MVQLQRDLEAIETAGIQVIGISYDDVEILKGFAERSGITFPLLSDPESVSIVADNVLNEQAQGRLKGIPRPGTFLLDSDGVIRTKLFLESNKSTILQLWINNPEGWAVASPLLEAPPGEGVESTEVRHLDFEVKVPASSSGTTTIPADALYNVCEQRQGACLFLRKDIPIIIEVEGREEPGR